jgi:hypothetical protein
MRSISRISSEVSISILERYQIRPNAISLVPEALMWGSEHTWTHLQKRQLDFEWGSWISMAATSRSAENTPTFYCEEIAILRRI